jgi:hypothetical protein
MYDVHIIQIILLGLQGTDKQKQTTKNYRHVRPDAHGGTNQIKTSP